MPAKAYAQEPSSGPGQLYAQSAVLMDGDSGRVLFEKNGYEQRPMASTTKIMTLIVTLENANLDEVVTVSDYAASMPDVQLGIRAGEQFRLEDLLYSLMLESHNDSAVAVAAMIPMSLPQLDWMRRMRTASLPPQRRIWPGPCATASASRR